MNEEANRKLLEFAGFTEQRFAFALDKEGLWKDPNGELCLAPDFFDPELGLGWLFKYVVPKVCDTGEGYEITLQMYWDGGELLCEVIIKDIDTGREFDFISREPQVALVNAILKWLESK